MDRELPQDYDEDHITEEELQKVEEILKRRSEKMTEAMEQQGLNSDDL